MNKGKNFERQFKVSAQGDKLFVLRLNDSSLSWQHEFTSKFTCESPCDFILYYKGYLFPIELKSTEYKSMSVQMDEEEGKTSMIKMHQWNSLSNFSMFEGVIPGLLLNFREKDSVKEVTYWVDIKDFIQFISTSNKRSINKSDVESFFGTVKVEQTLKRTNYIYKIKDMLDEIIKWHEM